jgi:hypothetical protein
MIRWSVALLPPLGGRTHDESPPSVGGAMYPGDNRQRIGARNPEQISATYSGDDSEFLGVHTTSD